MTTLREAAQQALEALVQIHPGNMTPMAEEAWNKAIVMLGDALAEQPSEQEPVQDECNRVINHAIEQGIEASVFLSCWQEGDWSGCAEFGFEPNMAAYTAPQPAIPPGYKLVPEVPTNEWIHNLARRQTGSFEKAPFAEIHQCIAELLESAPEIPQPAKPAEQQAARAQIEKDTALLRQALDALNHVNVQDRVQIIAALRARVHH